jgi:hypothetical protein
MSDKHSNDGGPAFPVWELNGKDQPEMIGFGMTLRDYFEVRAMQGLLANPGGAIQQNGMSGWGLCNCTIDDVAEFAWHIADAMLKARGGFHIDATN